MAFPKKRKTESAGTSTKREEVTTYQELKLGRTLKSKVRRAQAEKSGVHRVIGGSDPTRPFLQVLRRRYLEVRREITKEFLVQAQTARIRVSADLLLKQLTPRIEAKTYDLLAAEQRLAAGLETNFVRKLGRHPTPAEKDSLLRIGAMENAGPRQNLDNRRAAIDEVLGKIETRQAHNPSRYQTAWTLAIGSEIAQQTVLEKIDKIQGVAFFRCLNSALSYHLQRQPDLPRKLSKALGFPIRALKVLY
jgi:hypothetical protein